MFVTFFAAVLLASGAVGLLAIIPSWWMLVIALGIHAIGTIIVYVLVLLVVSDELGSIPSGQPSALGRARWALGADQASPVDAVRLRRQRALRRSGRVS